MKPGCVAAFAIEVANGITYRGRERKKETERERGRGGEGERRRGWKVDEESSNFHYRGADCRGVRGARWRG